MGMDPNEPEWASWMMPTATNPYIHPDEIAAAKLLMPPRSFDQEFMAKFLDTAAGGLFDPEKWRYCSEAPHLAQWIRYWDLAVEVKKENDHTSGAMVGLGEDGTMYINRPPTFWREAWPVSRSMIKQITDDDRKWVEGYGGLYRPAIEKAGQQKGLIDDLNWGEKVYFYPEGVKGDKKERCSIWAWRQFASKVCLVGEPSEWQGFIGRCHVFTGKGEEQDDDIDAVSGAFGLLYKSDGKEVRNEKTFRYGSPEYYLEEARRKQGLRVG
jgi:phage terminase large subunit-like protein